MKKWTSLFFLYLSLQLHAQHHFTVQADKVVSPVSPAMWGVFFEDINFGADGGLYAEMIKNRAFEFPMPMMGWKEIRNNGNGKILIENADSNSTAHARYAHIRIDAPAGGYGISNEGFRGMGFAKGASFHFSIRIKKLYGNATLKLEAVNSAGKTIATTSLKGFSDDWQTYQATLTTTDSTMKGKLNLWFEGNGEFLIDRVSLFPEKTWKDRPNGLRADLVQLLYDMKPGFVRFPGGCIVEGRELTNRYQWKATVGPAEQRTTMVNRWNMEFRHRPAPDYFQSFGLGFFEYFQLAEDIGAAPLPILNCGMACQFNSSEVAAMDQLDPYIQDALDLIEFANGDVNSRWGKMRADMGHPAPFHLTFMGIGNEQWDEQYIERYKKFHEVLKQKHPEIQLISSVGPSPEGKLFDYAWQELKKLHADVVDEHYYASPEWFLKQAGRYDHYDRKGPRIFAGEYAAQSKGIARVENQNNWQCALSEAAFMTGLERNADVVQMASYAPLFAHVDAWQWTPDLIWFDNLQSYGTPNYFVQKLFSLNRGTDLISIQENGMVIAGKDSLYASAVLDRKTGEAVIKIVNVSSGTVPVSTRIEGRRTTAKKIVVQELSSPDLQVINNFEKPGAVVPVNRELSVKGNTVELQLKPCSLTIIRVPCK